jgi:hypothetical protein
VHASVPGSPGSSPAADRREEPSGRAKYQIATILCTSCNRGWQLGGGAKIEIDAPAIDRARCDAQYIGSLTGAGPERAYQDVPPAMVRFIWMRDGGRCQTPGCRSARDLELHHLVRRTDGGSNDASNLSLRCGSCHRAHHEGRITIRGIAPDHLEVVRHHEATRKRPTTAPGAAASTFERATTRTHARDALVGLGWKPGIARAAVEDAMAHVGEDTPIDVVIREALRRCPRPRD